MGKHNPERTEFKGRSYKKGGERVEALRYAQICREDLGRLALEYLDAEGAELKEDIMDQVKRTQAKLAYNLKEARR